MGYSYIEVLKEIVLKVIIDDYAGRGTFVITNEQAASYINLLQKMYRTLKGECLLEDNDFGNKLRLFFNGRLLLIDGYFYDGVNSLTFKSEVDQTIIPEIISLLKS